MLASRMDFSMVCRKIASNWLAASRSAASPPPRASLRSAVNCWKSVTTGFTGASSDDQQLGAQRARLLQGLEDGHPVPRRRAHAVHGLDDLVQAGPGLEQEHPVRLLGDLHLGIRQHYGFAIAEGLRLAGEGLFADGDHQ